MFFSELGQPSAYERLLVDVVEPARAWTDSLARKLGESSAQDFDVVDASIHRSLEEANVEREAIDRPQQPHF